MALNQNNRIIEHDLGPISAYAIAVAEGFKGSRAEWESYIAGVGVNAEKAHEYALVSEGYANGKQDGVDVTDPLSPYHGNNANYYAELARSFMEPVAPAYDQTETYSIGDVVMHDGLKICIATIDVPEVWNESHWESTTVYEAVLNRFPVAEEASF